MDKKLIREYGEDILCYRIRTARQKKRMQYEDFDKQLIQLYKERDNLCSQQRKLGWEPLHPPVQKGWKRFFVLRDDVARSTQAPFFEGILKKINTYDWSYKKDFKVRKRRYGRNKYGIKTQQLLQPDEWHFSKLEFTEREKQLFHEVWKSDWKKQPVKHYAFNEPWRFVLRIRPNMIDKVRKRDVEIERRLDEIQRYLEGNDYEPRQTKLMHGNYRYRWRDFDVKEKEKYAFRFKSMQQVIDITANDFTDTTHASIQFFA